MGGPIQFTGVLLSGGKSRRMGRDKALITFSGNCPLWRLQLEKLQGLGLAEVVVSGPPRPGFPRGLRCLADAYPGRGPLGGLGTVLDACPHRPVLVLAVDVPGISAAFLKTLLAASSFEVGRVPKVGARRPVGELAPKRPGRAARSPGRTWRRNGARGPGAPRTAAQPGRLERRGKARFACPVTRTLGPGPEAAAEGTHAPRGARAPVR